MNDVKNVTVVMKNAESWLDMYCKLSTMAALFEDGGNEMAADNVRDMLDILWYQKLTPEERASFKGDGNVYAEREADIRKQTEAQPPRRRGGD